MATRSNFLTDIYFKNDIGSTLTGDMKTVSGIENLNQSIFHRLITAPGTMVHRPNYGIGVSRYKNKLNTSETRADLAEKIFRELSEEERISEIISVAVEEGDSSSSVVLKIKYVPKGYDPITQEYQI